MNQNQNWLQPAHQLVEQAEAEQQEFKAELQAAWATALNSAGGKTIERWLETQAKCLVGPAANHIYTAGYQDAFKTILGLFTTTTK